MTCDSVFVIDVEEDRLSFAISSAMGTLKMATYPLSKHQPVTLILPYVAASVFPELLHEISVHDSGI
jgi:hypothetical protein